MNADLPRKPHPVGRVVVLSLTALAVVAGAGLISACSQQSDNQTAQQQPQQQQAAADDQARKDADEKAWAEAVRTDTVAGFNAYLEKFSAGAHVGDALQRIATLNDQARKDADEKAWNDAVRA